MENKLLNEDGSFKMIEYDGYLDRSRLGALDFSRRILLYSKRFFSDFQKILIKK